VQTAALTVRSAPVFGIPIEGTPPGITDYRSDSQPGRAVSLTAPESIAIGGTTYTFNRWYLNNLEMPSGQRTLQFTLEADTVALASYDWRLLGDVNGDCIVNILDLIHVRKRLNSTCSQEP